MVRRNPIDLFTNVVVYFMKAIPNILWLTYLQLRFHINYWQKRFGLSSFLYKIFFDIQQFKCRDKEYLPDWHCVAWSIPSWWRRFGGRGQSPVTLGGRHLHPKSPAQASRMSSAFSPAGCGGKFAPETLTWASWFGHNLNLTKKIFFWLSTSGRCLVVARSKTRFLRPN